MILGRTSSGVIKIKTDSPNGLRAVECECCEPPCKDFPPNGLVITKDQYKSWRKGGTLDISVSISDTIPSTQNQIDEGCLNGTCSWAYSTSINVPPLTCFLQFTESGPQSCYAPYYATTEKPSVVLSAGAYRSIEDGTVYRARLSLSVYCPFLWYIGGVCFLNMCLNSTFSSSFANTGGAYPYPDGNFPYSATIPFLGATFYYGSRIDDEEGNARSTASLSLTFTPNP